MLLRPHTQEILEHIFDYHSAEILKSFKYKYADNFDEMFERYYADNVCDKMEYEMYGWCTKVPIIPPSDAVELFPREIGHREGARNPLSVWVYQQLLDKGLVSGYHFEPLMELMR